MHFSEICFYRWKGYSFRALRLFTFLHPCDWIFLVSSYFCSWLDVLAGDIPAGTSEDVDAAVKAAKEAFYRNRGKDWAKASGKHRATYLRAIAKRVSTDFFLTLGTLGWLLFQINICHNRGILWLNGTFHWELIPYDNPLVVLHTKSMFFPHVVHAQR